MVFDQFIQTVSAVAQSALPAQFLPDLWRKLAGRLYRENARRPARKRTSPEARIVIERSEFEPFLERLQSTLEHLRRYAPTLLLLLVFCHNLPSRIYSFGNSGCQ